MIAYQAEAPWLQSASGAGDEHCHAAGGTPGKPARSTRAVTIGRIELRVSATAHVEELRREALRLSFEIGFPRADAERIALATTELASNLTRYARNGRVVLQQVAGARGTGIQIESHDDGPGIADVELALTDGFSSGGGLGSGLPAAQRLLHEFEIDSGAQGTDIVGRRWVRTR